MSVSVSVSASVSVSGILFLIPLWISLMDDPHSQVACRNSITQRLRECCVIRWCVSSCVCHPPCALMTMGVCTNVQLYQSSPKSPRLRAATSSFGSDLNMSHTNVAAMARGNAGYLARLGGSNSARAGTQISAGGVIMLSRRVCAAVMGQALMMPRIHLYGKK